MQTLRVGTSPDLPPFESVNLEGQLIGFDIDLAQAIGEVLHKKVEFRQFDFDALILALKNGQIDLIMSGLSITPSRQAEINMIPYQGEGLKSISFLFWQEIPAGINNFADLAKLTRETNNSVSVQAGHYLEDFLTKENITVKALAGPPEQILDLKYSKSIGAALDTPNAEALTRTHEGLKLLTIELPKEKWDLGNGIGIKQANLELTEQIKQAIEKLKSDGTIERLETKWLKKSGQ